MFWGCVLKDGKSYKTQSALEDNDYPVLHISNVALPKNAQGGKVYLTATMGKAGSETIKDLVIATLQKDKVESIALDLYVNVSQQITLSASAELHVSGFFEPQREGDDDEGMFMDGEEIGDEDESEEEEASGPSSKKLNQSLKQAQANAKKNVLAAAGGDDDEDDEDDEDDYDDEDLEDDEDGEDEEDESEDEKPVAKKP